MILPQWSFDALGALTQTLEVCRNLGCDKGCQDSQESLLRRLFDCGFKGNKTSIDARWSSSSLYTSGIVCFWELALHQALQTNISHITMPKPSNACVATLQLCSWYARRTHWKHNFFCLKTCGPWLQSSHICGVAHIQSPEDPAIWAVAPASQKTQAWVKSEPQDISQISPPYFGQESLFGYDTIFQNTLSDLVLSSKKQQIEVWEREREWNKNAVKVPKHETNSKHHNMLQVSQSKMAREQIWSPWLSTVKHHANLPLRTWPTMDFPSQSHRQCSITFDYRCSSLPYLGPSVIESSCDFSDHQVQYVFQTKNKAKWMKESWTTAEDGFLW